VTFAFNRFEGVRCPVPGLVLRNSTIQSNSRDKTAGDLYYGALVHPAALPNLTDNIYTGNGRDNALGVVGGMLTTSLTLSPFVRFYDLTANVTIAGGAILTVPAGVAIRFPNPDTELLVVGGLLMTGTTGSPSRVIELNGEANATTPCTLVAAGTLGTDTVWPSGTRAGIRFPNDFTVASAVTLTIERTTAASTVYVGDFRSLVVQGTVTSPQAGFPLSIRAGRCA
jgi:hypothetical protein